MAAIMTSTNDVIYPRRTDPTVSATAPCSGEGGGGGGGRMGGGGAPMDEYCHGHLAFGLHVHSHRRIYNNM